jgi:hypothetical protein
VALAKAGIKNECKVFNIANKKSRQHFFRAIYKSASKICLSKLGDSESRIKSADKHICAK